MDSIDYAFINDSKALELHKNKKIFAIFDGKLNWCPENLSMHAWLIDSGMFSENQFIELVKGYTDCKAIYFYTGDFVTDKYTEEMAKSWCNSIDKSLPVYCGLEKGEVGERWKPITKIR